MEPLFAIITVTYNAASTLGRTIDSVDSQTFTDYEHIIVDGASHDGTAAIAHSKAGSRRRIVSEPDKGLYDAMNKGMSMTTGKYLIFLNAGDKFHSSDTLALFAKAISDNNTPGIVYGQTLIVDDNGTPIGPRHLTAPENLTLRSFADGMMVCHQAFVALRRIADSYNLKYRYSADYEWCIKCLQHSRKNVGLGSTPVIDYLSEGETTRHRLRSLRERFSIMCIYYGTAGTVFRHIKFLIRSLKRKL